MSEFKKEFDEAFREGKYAFWKIFWWVLIIVVLMSAAGGIWYFVYQPIRIARKTMDADNVIYNYEWFKKKHNVFDGYLAQIETNEGATQSYEETLPENKGEWNRYDRDELARLKSVVTGLRNECISVAREYNAHTEMANRKIFMQDVPANLDERKCME